VQGIKEHYKDVVDFNRTAGNQFYHHDDLQFWKAVENQAKLVLEEAKEVVEAASAGDPEELLKEMCDVMVVFSWLAELVYQANFDTDLAMKLVNANNNTKIFRTYSKAKETLEHYEENGLKGKAVEGLHIEEVVYKGISYYTVRNSDKKVLKPVDYTSVDLKDCLPDD